MPLRVYTLKEANRIRPEVECLVLEMIGAVDAASPEHTEYLSRRVELEQCEQAIRREGERLSEAHVILRDLGTGLVDFPARHRGRLIFLCWKIGEPSIRFWHETEAGAAGRRPVAELEAEADSDEGGAV